MQQPGEYAQPLLRVTHVKTPIVNGCKTVRLRTNISSGTSTPDGQVQMLVKNTGSSQVSLGVSQSNDYVNGPFTSISDITVAPAGQAQVVISPFQKFLEIRGTSGTGMVDIQLSSQIKFDRLAFDKSDVNYPQSLWAADLPGWSTL